MCLLPCLRTAIAQRSCQSATYTRAEPLSHKSINIRHTCLYRVQGQSWVKTLADEATGGTVSQREGTGGPDPHPRVTRIVPAVPPADNADHCRPSASPRLATAARRTDVPGVRPFAPHASGAAHPFIESDAPPRLPGTPPGVRHRTTTPPRTLGDTAERAAVGADSHSRRRRTTDARRLRPGDTALVTATTQLLAVAAPELDASEQRALVPIVPELELDLVAERVRERAHEPVTIVAATLPPARSPLVRLGAPKPHPHPRAGRIRLAVVSAMLTICLLAAVRFALPLTRDRSQSASYTSRLPTLNDNLTVPTGPWSTGSGVSETLGLGGGAAPGVKAPGSAGAPVSPSQPKQSGGAPAPAPSGSSGVLPAPLHPWPPTNPFMYVPGHPAFGMTDVNGYYYWAFGQCTWWAQYKKQNENLTRMGSAMYWAAGAASRGYRVGSSPAAGATVVFQPGVQGASGYGHVAHVEAVYPGGWFLMSEMNFYVNGGGWGRVDYRYAHDGWGVSFIY